LLLGFYHYQDSLVILDKYQKKYTYFLADFNSLSYLEKTLIQRQDKSIINTLIRRNLTGEFYDEKNGQMHEKIKIDNSSGRVQFFTLKDTANNHIINFVETGKGRISDKCFGWDWIIGKDTFQLAYSIVNGKGVLKSTSKKHKTQIFKPWDKIPEPPMDEIKVQDTLTPPPVKYDKKIIEKVEIQEKLLKPVIYLYPTEKQHVHVQINCKNAELAYTYPDIKKGWNFEADPSGKLQFPNKKSYQYLFWEGNMEKSDFQIHDGFVVKREDTERFFEEKFEEMGFLPQEYNDFIVFWTPILMKNEANKIHFAISSDQFSNVNGKKYNEYYQLNISPQPKSIFRLFMLYENTHPDTELPFQKIVKLKREGFTVVEWGGKKEKGAL